MVYLYITIYNHRDIQGIGYICNHRDIPIYSAGQLLRTSFWNYFGGYAPST